MSKSQKTGRHEPFAPAIALNSEIPFPDELEHLSYINSILEKALEEADSNVDGRDKEYMAQKRYMVEYRGEIDPHEMFQNELSLQDIDRAGAIVAKTRDRIAKLKESPWFARIDFTEENRKEGMECYIGRFSYTRDHTMLIFDWRAPIAGMFYDYEIGPAGYNAPAGRVEGFLTRKRQFRIKNGVMEYALETSANIQDNVLQRELSRTSDEKMKSIIATIQKEQNRIIRNEKAGTLLIQGVAGSGKTSIALHRIAFLLYRFKDRLKAGNVMILSPNRIFGDYISNVLPELGEEPVCEMSFGDLAEIQLEGVIGFEPEKDDAENRDEARAERVRYKSTLDFLHRLDRFIEILPGLVFSPKDYVCGRFIAAADFIQIRFDALSGYPVRQRLKMIAEEIHDRFTADNFMEDEVPGAGCILKSLNRMLRIKNSLALYKAFYQEAGVPDMFVFADRKTLEWADVYPFLYLRAAYEGIRESSVVRHLVVDEMQDYTPVQYAVLNLLFKCPKTILGDYGQVIHPDHRHTLEDLKQIYADAWYVELNKSYRSTCEIIQFAKRIRNVAALEPVERHGEEPVIMQCRDREEEIGRIGDMIRDFIKTGQSSLGILVRTDREARALYEALSEKYEVHLLSAESSRFRNGVSVTSIRMSKGLEFDQVIVADADSASYATNYDRSLLYIACTRALHKLVLLYTGKQTKLIGGTGRI